MHYIIRRCDLPDWIGLKRTAIDELIKTDPTFPKPFKIGPRGRAVGFYRTDVEAWLEAKRANQDQA